MLGSRALSNRSYGEKMQNHRVLHLLDSLIVGGTEVQAVELAIRMQQTGKYDVCVACMRKAGPLEVKLKAARIPIIEFNPQGALLSVRGIRQILRLAVFLRKSRFTVLHCHDLWSNLMGAMSARLARTPVVVTSQRDFGSFTSATGGWSDPWRKHILRFLQRHSSFLLVNAHAIKDEILREGSVPANKIRVIHNGVAWERFGIESNPKIPLPIPLDHRIVIINVANMNRSIKGHDTLIEAAGIVVNKRADALFLLVGEGEARSRLESRVRDANHSDNILFLGQRSDVPQLLASSDIGVLCSSAEGLPNSILEYMSAGLAIVATRVGGIPELIEHDSTGILVPSGSATALAEGILHVLNDENLASRLGTAAQLRARSKFSFERLLLEYESMYAENEEL
jgi:glycosyltransferase involved in cell wall biosynthesis